jgi:hypothetical protein
MGDPIRKRHQHDGEQRADVQDFQFFEQVVCDCQQEKDGDSEDDVRAGGGAALSGDSRQWRICGWSLRRGPGFNAEGGQFRGQGSAPLESPVFGFSPVGC